MGYWALPLILAAQVVSSIEARLDYLYSGNEVTFSWCADPVAVSHDIEIFKYSPTTPIKVGGAEDLEETRFVWTVPRLGLYYARVRSKNSEGASDWTLSYAQEDAASIPGCDTGEDFIIYADIAPPGG